MQYDTIQYNTKNNITTPWKGESCVLQRKAHTTHNHPLERGELCVAEESTHNCRQPTARMLTVEEDAKACQVYIISLFILVEFKLKLTETGMLF